MNMIKLIEDRNKDNDFFCFDFYELIKRKYVTMRIYYFIKFFNKKLHKKGDEMPVINIGLRRKIGN